MTTYKQRQIAERNAEIVRLARLGNSSETIARVLRISKSTVLRVRQENGLGVKQGIKPLTPELIEQARKLLEDGASRNETAATLHVSADQLRRALPDLKWDREAMRQAEHDTGQRAHTAPMFGHQASSPVWVDVPDLGK